MPISLFSLYEKLCGNINTQQGGHVKPHRNFTDWVNDVSFSLFETKFASQWGKSQKNNDDLARPFLERINLEVKNGIAKYPPNYGHFSAARIIFRKKDKRIGFLTDADLYDNCGNKIAKQDERPEFIDQETWEIIQSQKIAEAKLKDISLVNEDEFGFETIDPVNDDRWGAVMKHRFLKPTLENPMITQTKEGWEIAPVGIKVFVLSYLRKPKLGTFVYDTVPGDPATGQGDRIVFNESKSEPLEWDTLVINEFMNMLEKKYGKFIREDFIWQTSESDRKSTL